MNIDSEHKLSFSIKDIIGQRIAVLGISGSGKTNTVAVLAEELLSHLAMTIVDVEGEYYGLKEKYTLLVAGRSEHAEIPLMLENAPAIAEMSIRQGLSVILDLSEYDQEEMQAILLAYFRRLWTISTKLKTAYEIIIEEAHEFIPQGGITPLKTLLTRFALRGRKRGVGLIVSSQRSAKVEKDMLTQAGILFLQKVVHPIDLGVYEDLIPLPAKTVEQQARKLKEGEAFVVSGSQVEENVQIRIRHTFHAGATPGLTVDQPHLKEIDAKLLEELRAITARSVREGGSDEVTKLKRRLKDAEAKIAELEIANRRLQDENALLSKLSVNMNGHAAEMPTSLEIQQATVHHLHAPGIAVTARPVVESTIATKVIEAASVPPFNVKKFDVLMRRVSKVPRLEINILEALLVQGTSLYAKQIADWSGKPESVIKNNPPVHLLKLEFISRTREPAGFLYQATVAEYLKREYPGCNVDELISRLLKAG